MSHRRQRCRTRTSRRRALPFLVLPLAVWGCDEGVLQPPEAEDALFERYVALGNSITAGFQSGGINEATQEEAYPVLLAERMGTEFSIPAFNEPGCPAPLVNLLTGERAGGAGPEDCGLRRSPAPERLNNVAVPQATPLDICDNLADDARPNPLTVFILGGRTQAEAARAIEPTFSTIWVGNNDALGVATTGMLTDETLTPLDAFQDRYSTMLEELGDDMEGLLVGVAHPVFVPFLSFGSVYWELQQMGELPENFQVDESCSADPEEGGEGVSFVPFSYGIEELLLPAMEDEDLEAELNCAQDPPVLREDEVNEVTDRIQAYNQTISDLAEDRDWAFVDPNAVLQEADELGLIPIFPDFGNPEEPFGPLFSLDGIHPSGAFHEVAAATFLNVVNQHYDTDLEPIDGEVGGERATAAPDVPSPLRELPTVPGGPTRSDAADVDTGEDPAGGD